LGHTWVLVCCLHVPFPASDHAVYKHLLHAVRWPVVLGWLGLGSSLDRSHYRYVPVFPNQSRPLRVYLDMGDERGIDGKIICREGLS